MATLDQKLPNDEELTVPEVNLSSPALRAGAFHMGKYCENQNNVSDSSFTDIPQFYIIFVTSSSKQMKNSLFQEFMLCRKELNDPRQCLAEGRAVTACALEFFRKVKKTCYEEFSQYANCLDKSSGDLHFKQ